MSLTERLDKIRSSPKLQNQQQTSAILSAIEDTLRSQKSELTPTAYFAALLSLLPQYISIDQGIANKEVASAVVYLLDLITSHVPAPLLQSKLPQILTTLAPALTLPQTEAPLLRASIGCLESLLIAQGSQSWALPQSPTSPRGAVAALLVLAMDQRPKVRKRAQDALSNVLQHPPPSPSLDHPAAEVCAQTALGHLQSAAAEASQTKRGHKHKDDAQHSPGLMHALQLVKTVASAQNGWPSKKIDALCEVLLDIARGSNEFLTMSAFDIFEIIFAGLADEVSSSKLPRLLEIILELQPSKNDSQLLPPWIAVLSRGYDVAAQIEPEETFQKLPDLFRRIAIHLSSPSYNIRVSASEGLNSFLHTCIPDSVLLEASIMDDKALESIGQVLRDLLNVKYQMAWMEVFNVLVAAFEVLRWRASPLLDDIVKMVGDLRSDDSFAGKKEADTVLSAAIKSMGPERVLSILPLNLAKKISDQPGRAWLLPLLRDSVSNTNLAHFRKELVPLSETMFQRVLDHGNAEKTMEIKIFDTVVTQIWSCLPGYCELPLDVREAFDQSFAEMLSNLLYQQPQMRTNVCKALQNLVETNQAISILEDDENLVRQGRVSKEEAGRNIQHLAGFANNLLAVLFNVYSQTLPHNRGNLLQCINAYLSITSEQDLLETFERVSKMLESSLAEAAPPTQDGKPKQQQSNMESRTKMPPTSHTLMDLTITISTHLPRKSFAALFRTAATVVNRQDDPQLQKKAYKLIPRLAESEAGRQALDERNEELQHLLLTSASMATTPARRDRLESITQIISSLPASDLHFVPSIIPEVVISAKEVNEKARTAAFDLLVLMGEKMSEGGTVVNAKVSHMSSDAPPVTASLEEYFTMVSAGLAGATPHMISASITALTRLLYQFYGQLKKSTVIDLVQTMDLFLTSKSREIVSSVLGFVKVCIISLPSELMLQRLPTLIPNLIVWSHEHKAHFKAKVKHIFERMIRKFGVDIVERYTPEADRKLIANIRKTRERRKKKRDTEDADGEDGSNRVQKPKGRFESEYDEALQSSDSESGADSESSDELLVRVAAKGQKAKQNGTQFIVEDDEEPLDLLDRKSFAHVSSTKPVKNRQIADIPKEKAKIDLDGKLVFKEGSDDEVMDFDDQGMFNGQEPGDGTLEGGINAYVNAIKGADAPQRGQRGKLKFKNVRSQDDEDNMEIDEEDIFSAKRKIDSGRSPRGKQFPKRRGLGMDKTRGSPGNGKVQKSRQGFHASSNRRGRR